MPYTQYEKAQLAGDQFEAEYFWEVQPHQPGKPFCELLKLKGARYPYGSIIQVGAPMSPRYACEAFICNAFGRKRVIWIGEETSLKAAEQAVIDAQRFEVAA